MFIDFQLYIVKRILTKTFTLKLLIYKIRNRTGPIIFRKLTDGSISSRSIYRGALKQWRSDRVYRQLIVICAFIFNSINTDSLAKITYNLLNCTTQLLHRPSSMLLMSRHFVQPLTNYSNIQI